MFLKSLTLGYIEVDLSLKFFKHICFVQRHGFIFKDCRDGLSNFKVRLIGDKMIKTNAENGGRMKIPPDHTGFVMDFMICLQTKS